MREVDARREPDLFWAVRGGKGNFGVVTAMTIDLLPVSTLYAGGIYYAAKAIGDVLHAYARWAPELPEETTTSVTLLRLPPLPFVPPALLDTVGKLPYVQCGEIYRDPPDPLPFWEQGTLLRELPADAVDRLLSVCGPGVETPAVLAARVYATQSSITPSPGCPFSRGTSGAW